MSQPANVVSVHPYFKVKPGKLEAFKAALPAFIEKTAAEKGNLYYDFTINEDVVYCREAYVGADGFLAHLKDVGPLMGDLLKLADIIRFEIHGPAGELDKLRPHMGDLKPVWFTYLLGVERRRPARGMAKRKTVDALWESYWKFVRRTVGERSNGTVGEYVSVTKAEVEQWMKGAAAGGAAPKALARLTTLPTAGYGLEFDESAPTDETLFRAALTEEGLRQFQAEKTDTAPGT